MPVTNKPFKKNTPAMHGHVTRFVYAFNADKAYVADWQWLERKMEVYKQQTR